MVALVHDTTTACYVKLSLHVATSCSHQITLATDSLIGFWETMWMTPQTSANDKVIYAFVLMQRSVTTHH
jgi:hypothetical protein